MGQLAAKTAMANGEKAGLMAKAAVKAAKDAGGDGADIARAAQDAVKISKGEEPEKVPDEPEEEAKEEGNDDASSGGSSSSSGESERELPIAEKDKAKAKREGIAQAFYFGCK